MLGPGKTDLPSELRAGLGEGKADKGVDFKDLLPYLFASSGTART